MGCEECCKKCCYSTPFTTLFALVIIIVGIIGFIASTVYGIATISTINNLNQHILFFVPIVGGTIILTIFPLLLSTVMAYCVTGYIKDELFDNLVKKFIGPCCSFFSMCLNIVFFCLWLLLTVALSSLLTVVVQLKLSCGEITDYNSECLPRGNYTFINQICGSDLDSLCNKGGNAGIAFAVSIFFTIVVTFGLLITLMVQSANYVNARENMEYRRSYQPRNNHGGHDYMMKQVR